MLVTLWLSLRLCGLVSELTMIQRRIYLDLEELDSATISALHLAITEVKQCWSVTLDDQ
jgi:hypothetical protein